MKLKCLIMLIIVFSCNVVFAYDYQVGDKVRTVQKYTDDGHGYIEGYVLDIFETPDNTYVEKGHFHWLAVVDFGGSVYGNGIEVLDPEWLRKFDKGIDPPSYFWAVDEYRRTGILSKPKIGTVGE